MVNVKPGRARNHLVPHKMASYPNEHRLAEAAAKRETWDEAVVKEASEDAAAKVRHVGRRSRLGVNPEPYPRPKPRTRDRLPRTDVSATSGRLPRTVEFPKASTDVSATRRFLVPAPGVFPPPARPAHPGRADE